jgi:hypothetical protein
MSRPAADLSRNVELRAASCWRIEVPFGEDGETLDDATRLLGHCAGVQARQVAAGSSITATEHIVCSTVLSGLCPQSVSAGVLLDGMEGPCGHRPAAMLRAYECSGWGYALRYFAQHTDAREVLVSIVDADLHRSSMFEPDGPWGRSGFGVTTLLFMLPERRDLSLSIGRSDRRPGTWGSDTRAFANLVHAIRQRRARPEQQMIFVHFMVKHIRGALEHVVGTERISRNRFNELGHCFGADPWIGLIDWAQGRSLPAPASVTAASLSNNGYYTLCDVTVTAQTRTEFVTLPGDTAGLLAAVAAHPGIASAAAPAAGSTRAVPPVNLMETA